jgi:hypothetical protein
MLFIKAFCCAGICAAEGQGPVCPPFMAMRIRIQESQISADLVLYPEQSIKQKYIVHKAFCCAGICAAEGQGLRSVRRGEGGEALHDRPGGLGEGLRHRQQGGALQRGIQHQQVPPRSAFFLVLRILIYSVPVQELSVL